MRRFVDDLTSCDDAASRIKEILATLTAWLESDKARLVKEHALGDRNARGTYTFLLNQVDMLRKETAEFRVRTMKREATLDALELAESIYRNYIEYR